MTNTILLIEDDINLGTNLKSFLEKESFHVLHADTLKMAQTLRTEHNDIGLIILDWMLPDGQGIDFLKELRSKSISTPVIMLTARVDLIDKVIGLETGANDYLTKPFEPRELIARIRVQLRQNEVQTENTSKKELNYKDLKIDQFSRKVFFNHEEIVLTKMEYELLTLLVSNPGQAFSREELLNKVWGFENFPTTRTVDTHVLQLRQKLDESYIETLRGIGYRLAPN